MDWSANARDLRCRRRWPSTDWNAWTGKAVGPIRLVLFAQRPLNATEMRKLLTKRWTPPGVTLPEMDSEAVAGVIRITGGNFRLFGRLLTQIERITEINKLSQVSKVVVEAARENLVIGQT